ncbi:MAG: hypothetical protein LBU66_08360 [Treponema sp.]|jgi:tetratricopeptide (TPR) repeat protein|nr:hypothetical protein [Treponema sp.]
MKKSVILLIITVIFSSCVSMKGDIFVDIHRTQAEENLAKVEAAVVPLEAIGGTEARRQQNDITAARQMITGMEKEAAGDTDFLGKLTAWSGRLAILEGRYSEAVRLHRQSIAASPGNFPSIILSIRLEGDPAARLVLIEKELALTSGAIANGELNVEKGRTLIEANRFSEAAGAFDIAFNSGIAPVYATSYAAYRAQAWNLRNTDGVDARTFEMLARDTVTWNDFIVIIHNETRLLRFVSGGRNIGTAEYFSRLLERGFIPYTQDITVIDWQSAARPRADETVTRAGAAWLVWHLFAEARADRGLLSRYSARYATGANPRSPIADVPPPSPFFDSILGCVEREFMSLPDGRNFNPAQTVRGAELLTVLRKIDD